MDRRLGSSIGGAAIAAAMLVQTEVAQISLDVGSSTVELGSNMIAVVLGALALAVVISPSDSPEVGQIGLVSALTTVAVSGSLYAGFSPVADPIMNYAPWTGYVAALVAVVAFVAIAYEGLN